MEHFMNTNLKDIISDIEVVQGTAKDSGRVYYAVELTFINGYTKRMFLKDDERFAWVDAMKQLTDE